MRIPNPPCCAGRAKRSHSRSFSGDRPVIVGIRFVLSTSSRGTSRWLMSGTTRLRYVHLLSSLVPGARKKRRSACYTLFAHAFNLPKMWGLCAISDSFMSCDFRLRTRCSQDNIMACNEFSACPSATCDPTVWFPELSALSLHFAHMRFGKPSSSFNHRLIYYVTGIGNVIT